MGVPLIVRADDAGLCDSVNAAIVETITHGIARNVSVMVPAPAFVDAVQRLKPFTDVCIGMHLTLNSEWVTTRLRPILPASRVPSLVDNDGYLLPTTVELFHRSPPTAELIDEATAQLRHARAAGLKVAYLDEHMGVGWLPGLREELIMMARREGLIAAETIAAAPQGPSAVEAGTALMRQLQARYRTATVVVTHPGLDQPDLHDMYEKGGKPGTVAANRDAERRVLISDEAKRAVADSGADLMRFTDYLTAGSSR